MFFVCIIRDGGRKSRIISSGGGGLILKTLLTFFRLTFNLNGIAQFFVPDNVPISTTVCGGSEASLSHKLLMEIVHCAKFFRNTQKKIEILSETPIKIRFFQ